MVSRRTFLKGLAASAAAVALSRGEIAPVRASSGHGHGGHKLVSPDEAISLLRKGNERYATMRRLSDPGVGPAARMPLTKGQWPYATILSCSDSRVPPEIIFDEGLGRLFIVRNAGNVVDDVSLGSIEYASLHSTSRLILVLGHESCGAVGAAVNAFEHPGGKETPSIEKIVELLMPAVKAAKAQTGASGKDLVEAAVRENVRMMIDKTLQSKELKKMADHGKLKVVGGYYSLHTGKVEIWA